MFVVQSPSLKLLSPLFHELKKKGSQVERRPPFYFVSFCPFKRAFARQHLDATVLNPYEYRLWGGLRNGLMWLDEWPSFAGDSWRELRFLLTGQHHIVFFFQSFSLKGERWLFKEVFHSEYPDKGSFLQYGAGLPRVGVIASSKAVLERYCGEASRGLLIKHKKYWPTVKAQELFIPFCLWGASETLALAGRHRVVVMVASGRRSWRLWSWTEIVLSWFLSGQLSRDLIDWLGENQGRRHSHSQGPLSRATRHWHTSLEKWSLLVGSFLRRPRGRQEAQGLDSRDWLHDESRARSLSGHQRAS